VADPAEAYLVTSALQGVVERGTARALGESGRFGTLAGKTGTSNDWRDAWFVAYSPSLVVGAWVGYDDGRSIGLSGADAALPIVARFLERTETEDRWEQFPVPDGIETAQVQEDSDWSDCGRREVFLQGTAPRSECDDGWSDRRRYDLDERDVADQDEDDGSDDRRDQLERRASRLMQELVERIRKRAAQEERAFRSEARRFRIRWER
jgi:penicillin-binding protein 1A